ncbi:hypothetical protein B0H16DRAFT_1747381 [Mycena metata]|uniref:RING-type domain-containing protein n=1 Tax=Mycena metata TaxID=1033252 RepID=A0AAD7GTS3_9AGAR|nr:hypothetical protein B0H16DRAFT_1747381 [Mycena metata]
MEYPRAHLYQSNLRIFFPPAVRAQTRNVAANLSASAAAQPLSNRAFAPGVGASAGRPIDVDLWLANREFGDDEGIAVAAAIDVDAWVARTSIDAQEHAPGQSGPTGEPPADSTNLDIAVQAVEAGTVVVGEPAGEPQATPTTVTEKELFACGICSDTFNRPVITMCMHIFCDACITANFRYSMACPLCRSTITDPPLRDYLFEVELTEAVAAGVVAEPEGVSRKTPYTWPTSLFREV